MNTINFYFSLNISAWKVNAVPPQPSDWLIGGNGTITCGYSPKSVYTSYNHVEWTYQAPNTTGFKEVYFYLSNGRYSSNGHLKDRATHKQTDTQMKLIINETKAFDDGIYRGKIQGSSTATCQVNYITRSKVIIYIYIKKR